MTSPYIRIRRITASLLSALFLLILPACDRTVVIQGIVTDVAGEGLPGVAVTVRGRLDQAVSDGVGRYSLRSSAGTLDLELMKTGYTPGYLSLQVERSGAVEATPAVLWPLPQDKGVYLFENYRYLELTRIEPNRTPIPPAAEWGLSSVPSKSRNASRWTPNP